MAGPLGCLVLIPTAGRVLGVFDRFEWIGQDVSPLQAFFILETMCAPVAAWFYARVRRDVELSRMSRSWPTVPGVLEERKTEQRVTPRGSYEITLGYSYEVGGLKYRGDRLAFAPSRLDAGALLNGLRQRGVLRAATPRSRSDFETMRQGSFDHRQPGRRPFSISPMPG